MSSTHQQPLAGAQQALIEQYLTDLERVLRSKDPDEAADTLASVREHIDSAVAQLEEPDAAAIRAILTDLGPVERIGDAADAPIEGTRRDYIPGTTLAIAGLLAVLLAGFWMIAAPLGLIVLVTGLLMARRQPPGGLRSTYRVAAAFGAAAIIITTTLTVFFVSATTAMF